MQAITGKPANGDVDLSLTHQLVIVHDADEQSGEHQPYRRFGIDARPAIVRAITRDLFPQPRQVEHTIAPRQHVLIWDELFEMKSSS